MSPSTLSNSSSPSSNVMQTCALSTSKEMGSSLQLDPSRNMFTAQELMETRVGDTPDEANGWGIMDHGVGSMEKVQIVDGKCVSCDMGEEIAYVYIGGRMYRLRGTVLTEED